MHTPRLPPRFDDNAFTRRRRELEAAGAPLLDLTETNPTRVGLPGASAEALARLADPAVRDYDPSPAGRRAAREAVAAYYADHGARVDPDDVVLTASTSEAYAHVFRLLAAPGEAFLVPEPSYPLFGPLAALEGVRLVPYPLRFDGRWWLDREAFRGAATAPGVRGVLLVQPNNPTGSVLDAAETAFVRATAIDSGLPLLVDEVFLDHGAAAPLATLAAERAASGFVLSGLSKVAGLPQMKLGWMVAFGPDAARRTLVDRLHWVADAFLSVGAPVQAALPSFLAGRAAFLEATRARLTANEVAFDARAAGSAGSAVTRLPREGGWSTILRLPATRSDDEWALALLDAGVVVHPGHFYDITGLTTVVASLLVPEKTWDEAIARLVPFAADH
jgi:alanine-synthesizing transaminase